MNNIVAIRPECKYYVPVKKMDLTKCFEALDEIIREAGHNPEDFKECKK